MTDFTLPVSLPEWIILGGFAVIALFGWIAFIGWIWSKPALPKSEPEASERRGPKEAA